MKLTTTKSALLRAATFAASGISGRSTLPVLSHLLLTADERITLTGSNINLFTSAYCEAEVEKAGAICVPASLLISFVKSAPDEQIEMELGKKLTVRSGKAKANIAFLESSEFVARDPVKGESIEVPAELLKEKLGQVKRCVSEDPSRFILNSVFFQFDGKALRLVTSDGRRLALAELPHSGEGEYVVPTELAERVYAALGSGTVKCTFAANKARFEGEGWAVDGQLVDGTYANWRQVVPNVERFARIDRDAFRSVLQRAQPFTTEKAIAVRLDVAPKSITVTAGNGENSFEDSIACVSEVELTIAVNPAYALDALAGCGPEIQLGLMDELSPMLFTGENYKCVVMPLRLQ